MTLPTPDFPTIAGSLDSRDYTREPAVLLDPWWVLRVVRMRQIVRGAWRPARPVGNRLTRRKLRAILKASAEASPTHRENPRVSTAEGN